MRSFKFSLRRTILTPCTSSFLNWPGARIMEADDRQLTTVFSLTIIPPSAHDKPSIMKLYHRWRTCSHTSPRCSSTMVTLHDTRFVECQWWNDGWTVVTWQSSASTIPAPEPLVDERGRGDGNSSVGSVFELLSCVMQHHRFKPPLSLW